jgi:hypothetical protein
MECVVPQPFASGGNRPYLDFWAVTCDPWYKTLIVSPEPSVEPVAGASHSTGRRKDTCMMLWFTRQEVE